MPELNSDVRYIKGIGEQRAKSLAKLGITTLFDLISYFPRGYEDRSVIYSISQAPLNENCCVSGIVASTPKLSRVRRGMELVKLRAVDDSGAVDITFFNQSYVREQLVPGKEYIFYGKLSGTLTHRSMTNPLFEPEDTKGTVTNRIVPIYRLTAGLSQKTVMNAVKQGLTACAGLIPPLLPENIRLKYQLCTESFAYENIHFPSDPNALSLARRHLIFEEFFLLSCAMSMMEKHRRASSGKIIAGENPEEFFSRLPFSPTDAQRRAVSQALSDMASGTAMNRLIQGDVGSGKTLVAAACIWAVCKQGYQCAFMAPTEILVNQHYDTLSGLLGQFGIRITKLTGSMSAREKRETLSCINSGTVGLVVGTHALLSESVGFADLALVITDEQHRFGVAQRAALSTKTQNPHVLVMSATPIPRTLALIIYGDLDISVIDELPQGRIPVETFLVNESYRTRIHNFIRRLVAQGRQAFIVCPMIDEDEDNPSSELKSAEQYATELQTRFLPELSIACVHGKMKPKSKDEIMAAFVRGEYDVLVSTTVIEVGVDVPNAALMIIENADRFGLSQLHQLRGRVGRGTHKSYCVMFSNSENQTTLDRLKIMCQTTDGFKISEEDLRLRGPGDFFGNRQHGLPQLNIASFCADTNILESAQLASKELLCSDPRLSAPQYSELKNRVQALISTCQDTIN